MDRKYISARRAKELNNGTLPRHGYESLVEYEGKFWWMSRAWPARKRLVWELRDAGGWRLVNGRAVLGDG